MNPLDQYPQVRRYLYMFQWVVNGILAIAAIIFTVQGKSPDEYPDWYLVAAAIAPFLWTYLGITAQTNVSQMHTPAQPPDQAAA